MELKDLKNLFTPKGEFDESCPIIKDKTKKINNEIKLSDIKTINLCYINFFFTKVCFYIPKYKKLLEEEQFISFIQNKDEKFLLLNDERERKNIITIRAFLEFNQTYKKLKIHFFDDLYGEGFLREIAMAERKNQKAYEEEVKCCPEWEVPDPFKKFKILDKRFKDDYTPGRHDFQIKDSYFEKSPEEWEKKKHSLIWGISDFPLLNFSSYETAKEKGLDFGLLPHWDDNKKSKVLFSFGNYYYDNLRIK